MWWPVHIRERFWQRLHTVLFVCLFVCLFFCFLFTVVTKPENPYFASRPGLEIKPPREHSEGYAEYFSPKPMPKPPGGPQTPPPPPPPVLNCWLWSVVSAESICFFGVLQGLNYVLPPTRFKPLWAVRFVTKFTSKTFNRRVEKFFRRCCSCYVVRPRPRCSSLPLHPKCVQNSPCCIYQGQIRDG